MNILVYDSGVGGRSVFKLLEQFISNNNLHQKVHLSYFADTANYPYGTKTEQELESIVFDNVERFKDEGFDIVAVACNTASAIIENNGENAINRVATDSSKVFSIIKPTIELIEKLKPSSIFVIASNFTAEHHVYQKAIHSVNPEIVVVERGEQSLINHIEMGFKEEIRKEIEKIIRDTRPDEALLWGCTHFSLVKEVFEKEIAKQGKNIQIIDPANELAKKVIEEVAIGESSS